ncbi:N-formylglutamate amidohydrolase [Congregibacter variabilis]|uniref:N-formylglutamate amidohydrolase n=1 Tax=Congregibacter variabilis TaxID=3081200 RepID=A0ABZ0I2X3_9GAMM|nr:N-formylglutamate amidohydrolase [Congregibacter sp. IMCC43200]
MTDTFVFAAPEASHTLPLVFDSPHSGQLFPSDFVSRVQPEQLLTGCDLFVDDLWESVPAVGGHLLSARYSRMYVDLNRAPDDIDPLLLEGPLEGINPTAYSERGMGLIRRLALPDVPMYDSRFSLSQIHTRIHEYHKPYHQQLKSTLDALHERFSGVWHIDCHSMKSRGNRMNIDSGALRPDVVLGDNDGHSAGADFIDVIEQAFVRLGYSVVRNSPYKGGYLVRNYGDVTNNRHSMQIEINRALYMNEQKFSPNENYAAFKKDLFTISQQIADFVAHTAA